MKIAKPILYTFFVVMMAALASCSRKSQSPLSIFEGIWKMETDEGAIYEEWEKVSDSLLTGMSYVVKDGDTILIETLSIKYADGKLCYVPKIQNQNEGKEVLFPLKEYMQAEKKFVFENITHDFPQRIIYHFADDKTLNARIEGEADGKFDSSDYNYKKQ